jgi:hypothetical protein
VRTKDTTPGRRYVSRPYRTPRRAGREMQKRGPDPRYADPTHAQEGLGRVTTPR